MWPESAFAWEFTGTIGVALSVVTHHLCFGEVSNISYVRVSSPDLTSRYETTSLNDRVWKNLTSSLKSGTLLDNRSMSNNNIVIDDTRVNIATWFNGYILANVKWGSHAVWEGMSSMECASIANWTEMTDSDGVELSSHDNTVPDCSILGYENVTCQGSIWSNPSIINSWYLFVEW